jgi:hypothetical protein
MVMRLGFAGIVRYARLSATTAFSQVTANKTVNRSATNMGLSAQVNELSLNSRAQR